MGHDIGASRQHHVREGSKHSFNHTPKQRPSSAKALKHKRVSDDEDEPTVYDDFEEPEVQHMPRQRPASAKALKHKRVVDDVEEPEEWPDRDPNKCSRDANSCKHIRLCEKD